MDTIQLARLGVLSQFTTEDLLNPITAQTVTDKLSQLDNEYEYSK